MPYRVLEPRFPLGEVFMTAVAAEGTDPDEIMKIIHRHHCGDWGDLGEGDKQANEEALTHGERILSRYDLEAGSFYIVTEADRSMTTVMRVEEY